MLLKDLLRAPENGVPLSLAALTREACFVPETARISFVLREFQRHQQHLARVVDEYGRVVGLVTLEDVLEEIVGEIREEGEATAPAFAHRLADGSYILDGLASIRDVRDQLISVARRRTERYHTVAGFLIGEQRLALLHG